MMPTRLLRDRVHLLWDALADFDAAQIDLALGHLMQGLCDLVSAPNAEWFGLTRVAGSECADPAGGGRPPAVRFLHPTGALDAVTRRQAQGLGSRVENPATSTMLAHAGRFRAYLLRELAPPEWFGSATFLHYYRDVGRDDAIYVAFPVNEDTESCFGIFRAGGQPAFTIQDRDTAAYALRGIKWFHRQLLLSHGQFAATAPLTQVERTVLRALLAGLAEKAIAVQLGHSANTTHGHVKTIYRKFGVNNRPALMALWLGRAA